MFTCVYICWCKAYSWTSHPQESRSKRGRAAAEPLRCRRQQLAHLCWLMGGAVGHEPGWCSDVVCWMMLDAMATKKLATLFIKNMNLMICHSAENEPQTHLDSRLFYAIKLHDVAASNYVNIYRLYSIRAHNCRMNHAWVEQCHNNVATSCNPVKDSGDVDGQGLACCWSRCALSDLN